MGQARLAEQGGVTVVARNCANISCLATYPKRVANLGSLAIIATSSPTHGVVAPLGGKQGRVSSNPMAIGIPTEAHPIVIDTSTASVSNRQIEWTRFAGARLAQPVLMGPDGKLSDDPNAFCGDPKGAIMPVGESNSVIRVSPSRSWLKR
jgi:LDH2 family malate/lactate/ureidoglycolate dehydrogenase